MSDRHLPWAFAADTCDEDEPEADRESWSYCHYWRAGETKSACGRWKFACEDRHEEPEGRPCPDCSRVLDRFSGERAA